MPTTAKGLPYPNASDPVASGAANIQALAQAIDPLLGALPTPSPTPPASPVDGQLWTLLADSVNSAIPWVFRYRAASPSAYKWEFVGGAAYTAAIATAQTLGVANTWTNIGPVALPIPRSGEYYLSAFANVSIPSAGVASPYLAVYYNAAANVIAAVNGTGNATWALSLAIVNNKSVRTAGETIGLAGFGPVSTSYAAGATWSILPVRVS